MLITKHKKIILLPLLSIFLLAAFFGVSLAQTSTLNPRQINISAHIINNSNKEITNGDYTIRFAIYAQDREINDPYPSDTDRQLWEETQTVKLRNGYLEAFVGSINPIPKEVNFTSGNYYLGIRINTDSEMVPRKRIGAAPLAFNSFQLEGAEIGTQEGDIPLLGPDGLLDVAMMPPVTDLGTIAAGVWEGDVIADEFIAEVLAGKTYNGLTLTANTDGFSIAGGDTERTLTLSGGNVILSAPEAAGSVAYSNGTSYAFSGAGTVGQVLTSNGSEMPIWQSVAGVVETDPIFSASAVAGIVVGDISNWNSAYGWGNHGAVGYVTGTPWTSLGYITDGNTGWDNSYGFITDGNTGWDNSYGFITNLATLTTDNLTQGSTNLYSQWGTNGLNVYYNSGNVGIGTIAPGSTLDVAGIIRATSGANYLEMYHNGTDAILSTNTGEIMIGAGGDFILDSGVNLGIGVGAPLGMLHIGSTSPFIVTSEGLVGIGTTVPTASLQIKAGTIAANTAPLKFTAGVNMTTAEAGAFEYDGSELYFTPSGTTRRTISYLDSAMTGTLDGVNLATGNQGGIPYFSSTTQLTTSAAGTIGQALISGGTGAPTWFAPTAGSILFAGTGGILAQDNANFFWEDTLNYLQLGNGTANKFSFGLDSGDSDKFKIYSGSGIAGTSEFSIDTNGLVSISNLEMGAQVFADDSGAISWVDMGVTSGAADNTVESYTAQLDGTDMLTIYGQSNGLGGVDNLRVLFPNGNVGIGTTDPGYKLDVSGNTRILGNIITNNTSGGVVLANNADMIKWNESLNGDDLYFSTGAGGLASSKIYFQSGGNVGIGTTTPLLKLDVAGSGRFTATATSELTGDIDPAASTTVAGTNTLFLTELVVGDRITVTGETRTVTAIASNISLTVDTAFSDNVNDTTPDKLPAEFIVRDASNNLDFIVSDQGYLGIGTASPSAKLHINGGTGSLATGLAFGDGDSGVYESSDDVINMAIGGNVRFSLSNNVLDVPNISFSSGNAASITNISNADLIFGTNATEKMRILAGGNVGIGLTPTARLHLGGVAGTVSLEINSNETTATNNVLALRSDVALADDMIFRVQANGAVFADGAYTGTGADYAEYFKTTDTDLVPGEAVCIDPVRENAVKRCVRSADNNVMGIISDNPSIVGNSADGRDQDKNYKIVAMLGQIKGKVSTENGAIQIGDSLTSASIPGYLRKANAEESTVGIALQNFAGDKGTIQILISRRNKSLTVEKVEEAVSERIAEMNVEDQVNVLIESARAELDESLENRFSALEGRMLNQESLTKILEGQVAELKKKLDAETNLAQIDLNTQDAQFIKLLLGVERVVNPEDVDILGRLSAKTLTTGGIEITIIDPEAKTIGEDSILAGESVKFVETKAVTVNSKIYITPIGSTDNQVIYVGAIVTSGVNGFEVKVDRLEAILVPNEIRFNWWIVESK